MERPGGSEIVELTNGEAESCQFSKRGNKYSIEDDINRLFEAIDIKSSSKGGEPVHGGSKERLMKKAMKRPMRAGSPQSIGIGISETVNLKQALRGLCISQASEMAATKRLSRLGGSSGTSESGNTKGLNKAVVVETSGSGLHFTEGNGNLVEISLVPEISRSERAKPFDQSVHCPQDIRLHLPTPCEGETSGAKGSEPSALSSLFVDHDGIKDTNAMSLAQKKLLDNTPIAEEQKNLLNASSSLSSFKTKNLVKTFSSNSPSFIKPIFRNKSFPSKKVKQSSASPSSSCISLEDKVGNSPNPSILGRTTNSPSLESVKEDCDDASPSSSNVDHSTDVNSSTPDAYSSTMVSCSNDSSRQRYMLAKIDQTPRIKEKGDVSQSSKSSIGEYSSGTSISEDSSLSWSSRSGNRPHMSRDLRWEAIRQIQKQQGSLCLKHFKLVKKLGCGDIGSVYLAELTGTNCLFALKVMDTELLASRKKLLRAQTEKEILQMLDHPFLPTLYANLISEKLSCLVMEYCPGGDLHVLRQRQAGRSFSEQAVRFYAAEVLLSIEYLHMLGVVYRDLKPENVLVREDGHIMLSDFDLSLRCRVDPIVVQSSSPAVGPTKKTSSPCLESSCIEPFCLHPSWQVSCFTPRLLSVASKSRKLKSDLAAQISPLPQLVVEPTSARSNSFVGTYEYLAPEIVKSEGHGSAVDWWTFGIFLFELLYGKTPFKGSGNDETLANVVSRSLRFPSSPMVSYHARDLIRWLLVKEPENRLGSGKGAADIKQHSFFEGLNWALIRCAVPPELPQPCDALIGASAMNNDDGSKGKEPKSTEDSAYFDMF